MPIRNKDGSEYFFTQPNPTMLEQAFWDLDDPAVLEGQFGIRFTLESKYEPAPKKITVKSEPVIKQEEKDIEIVETIVKKQSEESIFKLPDAVIDMWCLPSVSQKDNQILYGEKVKIKAKVYDDESDLYIQIITRQPLNPHSIIYPVTRDRRWWKVINTNRMQEEGFYLVSAEISDYQPSFSD